MLNPGTERNVCVYVLGGWGAANLETNNKEFQLQPQMVKIKRLRVLVSSPMFKQLESHSSCSNNKKKI